MWIGFRPSCFLQYHWSLYITSGYYFADILVLCRFRCEDNVLIQRFPTNAEKRKIYFSWLDLFHASLLCCMWKSYIQLYRQEMEKKVNSRIVYICNIRLRIPWSKRADHEDIDDCEKTQDSSAFRCFILLVQISLLPISDSYSAELVHYACVYALCTIN